eukprot:scaffold264494_cov27-Tisochrysis_lutea.AAC.3
MAASSAYPRGPACRHLLSASASAPMVAAAGNGDRSICLKGRSTAATASCVASVEIRIVCAPRRSQGWHGDPPSSTRATRSASQRAPRSASSAWGSCSASAASMASRSPGPSMMQLGDSFLRFAEAARAGLLGIGALEMSKQRRRGKTAMELAPGCLW